MSDLNEVATKSIAQVADSMGVKVDPVLVAQLAGMVIGVLSGKTWAEAEQAGLDRAAKITSLEAAEAAAKDRR